MIWQRLRSAATHASSQLGQRLRPLFQKTTLNAQDWDTMEEILIRTDMGVDTAHFLMDQLRGFQGTPDQALAHIAKTIAQRLAPYEKALNFPKMMLMVGVNGSGKTTTIGKLVHRWHQYNKPVRVVAGDVFRAAAVDQLAQWVPDHSLTRGAQEPASLAYRGAQEADNKGEDLIVDTAGRLPNNQTLMDELAKIYRVMQKCRPHDTIDVIIVLDATVGQHALTQIDVFGKCVPLSGVIMTKMDGTAKGGILIHCAHIYKVPIYALGYGEKARDLQDFSASRYAQDLVGVDASAY